MNLSAQMMETIGCYKIVFPATKTFFSVFTQMCFQKLLNRKKEVLTSKVIFTLYLKPKKGGGGEWGKWGKTQEIMSL